MIDNKILEEEKMNMDDLDNVAGGNMIDRFAMTMMIDHYYGNKSGTRGKIIDVDFKDPNKTMQTFCDKAGIEYRANEKELDQVKIGGEWRDLTWLNDNKQDVLNFFDKQLGIAK